VSVIESGEVKFFLPAEERSPAVDCVESLRFLNTSSTKIQFNRINNRKSSLIIIRTAPSRFYKNQYINYSSVKIQYLISLKFYVPNVKRFEN